MTPIEQIIEKFDEQSIHDVECAIWDKNFNVCDCGIARASNFLEKALSSLQESTESRVREEERIKIFEDLEALAIEWEGKGFNDIFELQAYYDYKKSLLQDPKKQ